MQVPYSRTLFDLLCEQAERYPDQLAVISGDSQTTYSQLRDTAARIASGLHAIGIAQRDRVGLLIDNRVEWLEICFGAAALGAIVVPFSTWSKRRELQFLLKDSGVKALFAMARLNDQDFAKDIAKLAPALTSAPPGAWEAADYPALETVVFIGNATLAGALSYPAFADGLPALDLPLPPGDGARAADSALILYTSGSTSYPKAVPLAHGGIIENGYNIGERQGLSAADRVLLSPPLFWSYGSANAMSATFTHGATLVLQSRFEPADALDLIERHACTAIYTLPGMTSAMVLHPAFRALRTQSLRTGVTIGNPQDVAMAAEKLGARAICNVYGQTESYGNCCVTWHHWPLERRMRAQGPPLPGVHVRIVDETTGLPVAAGAPGLIEVAGYLTPGYDGASAQNNATAFTADGYFRTGDLGVLTSEGDLQFVARTTEMIKRAGINIAPAEVEEVLRQHPDVAEAGVVGAPDAEKGEIVLAFVVPKSGARLTEESLRHYCRTEAASYKAPDRVELCASLPTTPTGKLMRSELKQMAASIAPRGQRR